MTRAATAATGCSSSPTRPSAARRCSRRSGKRCRGRECEILVITPALAALTGRPLGLRHRRSDRPRPPADGTLGDRNRPATRPPCQGGDRRLRPQRRDRGRAARLPRRRDRRSRPIRRRRSRWLEGGVVERAREQIDLPIAHVVVDLAADGAARGAPAPLPEAGPSGSSRAGSAGAAGLVSRPLASAAARGSRRPGCRHRPEHRQPGRRRQGDVHPDDLRGQLQGPLDAADDPLEGEEARSPPRAASGPSCRLLGASAAARRRYAARPKTAAIAEWRWTTHSSVPLPRR